MISTVDLGWTGVSIHWRKEGVFISFFTAFCCNGDAGCDNRL